MLAAMSIQRIRLPPMRLPSGLVSLGMTISVMMVRESLTFFGLSFIRQSPCREDGGAEPAPTPTVGPLPGLI